MAEQLSSLWFKHLNPADPNAKRVRAELVLGNNVLLDILTAILEDEIKAIERSGDDYDIPNWPYKEADRKGQLKAYRRILSLTKRNKVNE